MYRLIITILIALYAFAAVCILFFGGLVRPQERLEVLLFYSAWFVLLFCLVKLVFKK